MFKVSETKNTDLNIFWLCKSSNSITKLCTEYVILRNGRTLDSCVKNKVFEYVTNSIAY